MHNKASSRRIERRLTSIFPTLMLEDYAEEVGVIERNRKLQMPALIWSFAFGFASGESRSLADFRRSYNATADDTLCPSGFSQQMTPELATYMRDLVPEDVAKIYSCRWETELLFRELKTRLCTFINSRSP